MGINNNASKIRSHGILLLVKIIPIFFIGLFALLPIFLPAYFPWVTDTKLYTILFIVTAIFQTWVVIMTEYKKDSSMYKSTYYIWVIFYVVFIYVTRGLDSSFMFTMVFVPIVALSYLDEKLMKRVGVVSTIFLASLIFLQEGALKNPAYVLKHFVHVAVYALMVYYLYGIMKEILHHKFEEEVSMRKFIETNELNKAKNIFLTAMSHQLRTPLTGVRWAIKEAIANKKSAKKMLEEAEKRVALAINTLNDILKTTEFDVGSTELEMNKKPVFLNSLIKKIISDLNFIVEIRGNKISYDMPEEISVRGDEKMLDLALTNIFDNALKYSPNGTVKISLSKNGDQVNLIVSDSGIGIEAEDLEYIFQKFYRGKNAALIDPNGSGIGLYTTKKIIEMHGGKVGIYSIVGKGTRVEVLLPIGS